MSFDRDTSFVRKPCFVYLLVYPSTSKPFYIGISVNPWWRFREHCHDRYSAAFPVLCEISPFTRDDVLKLHKECSTRAEAFDLEYHLVTTTPGLVNRPYRKGRAY